MQRDMDVIREILCGIADAPGKPSWKVLTAGKSDADKIRILYHIDLLYSARLLTGIEGKHLDGTQWENLDLTWDGHDFADAVRDPAVWKATKKSIKEAGGFTFDLVKELAKGFIKTKLKEHTGVEL